MIGIIGGQVFLVLNNLKQQRVNPCLPTLAGRAERVDDVGIQSKSELFFGLGEFRAPWWPRVGLMIALAAVSNPRPSLDECTLLTSPNGFQRTVSDLTLCSSLLSEIKKRCADAEASITSPGPDQKRSAEMMSSDSDAGPSRKWVDLS